MFDLACSAAAGGKDGSKLEKFAPVRLNQKGTRSEQMEPSVGIYQPFYKPSLFERLDPGFIPLDWMSNPAPALRELALHRHIAECLQIERMKGDRISRHQVAGRMLARRGP